MRGNCSGLTITEIRNLAFPLRTSIYSENGVKVALYPCHGEHQGARNKEQKGKVHLTPGNREGCELSLPT